MTKESHSRVVLNQRPTSKRGALSSLARKYICNMDGSFLSILVVGFCLVILPTIVFCIKAKMNKRNRGQVFSSELRLKIGGINYYYFQLTELVVQICETP